MSSLWCLIFAIILIFLSKLPLLREILRQKGSYDNHNPRNQVQLLDQKGQRALAAHQNTIESFPIFAACLLAGNLLGVEQPILWTSSIIFLAARIVYIFLYLADLSTMRSLVWAIGLCASMTGLIAGLL